MKKKKAIPNSDSLKKKGDETTEEIKNDQCCWKKFLGITPSHYNKEYKETDKKPIDHDAEYYKNILACGEWF